MDFFTEFSNLNIQRSWCTVGSFDGVHLGHQALIHQLVNGAHKSNCQAIVVTFSPHPAVFFGRSNQGYNLTSPEQRIELLSSLGVDQVITIKFDQKVSQLSAREFMVELKKHIGLVHFLAGHDFALGHALQAAGVERQPVEQRRRQARRTRLGQVGLVGRPHRAARLAQRRGQHQQRLLARWRAARRQPACCCAGALAHGGQAVHVSTPLRRPQGTIRTAYCVLRTA